MLIALNSQKLVIASEHITQMSVLDAFKSDNFEYVAPTKKSTAYVTDGFTKWAPDIWEQIYPSYKREDLDFYRKDRIKIFLSDNRCITLSFSNMENALDVYNTLLQVLCGEVMGRNIVTIMRSDMYIDV